MPDQPNSAEIRKFLYDSFSDEELATLCIDYFRDLSENFTVGMTKQQKILMLLEYCLHREAFPNLLAAIQQVRPAQFEQRFPQAANLEARPEPTTSVRDPKKIFICHAHQDADFAHRLTRDLQERGWRVWIAPDSIRPGEQWVEAIDRGLEESGMFILVLTPAAVKSPWVRDETNAAIELKQKGHLRVIPLNVADCDTPPLWNILQRIPFSGSYESGLKTLFARLEPPPRPSTEQPIGLLGHPQKMGTADALNKADQRISALTLPYRPPADSVTQKGFIQTFVTVLSTYTGHHRNQLLWVWLVVLTVVSIALLVVEISRVIGLPKPAPIATVTPTALPTMIPIVVVTQVSEIDSMVMVYVPAGKFLMGSAETDRDRQLDEQPPHAVYLDAFWIDRTEVTNEQYRKCEQAGVCQPPSDIRSYKQNSYYGNTQYDNYPVIYVSWDEAKSYCKWAGRRLPTEAEWEKAARGTDGRLYPWGNAVPDKSRLNFNDFIGDTTEVGKYSAGASPYGALDMAGNVREWTQSLDKAYPYNAKDGREDVEKDGPRVIRDGFWGDVSSNVRSAVRQNNSPGSQNVNVGFRCSR